MKNTLKDLNVYLQPKQKTILNTLVEENTLLGSIPVKPASHGVYNVYARTTGIDEMQEVDFDQELPTVGISFDLAQARLGKIGGTLAIPQDAAQEMGGYSKYAADRLPKIIAKAGNTQETKIYYNGLMQAAIANKNIVDGGGKTANKQYSMIAVHWDEGSVTGLYNPNDVSNGKLFVQKPLNGGMEYKVKDLNWAIGKEVACWLQFGLQIADPRYVKAIANIEPTANATDRDKIDGLPTGMMIDDLLTSVRGNGSNTVIYCHPALLRMLGLKFKLEERKYTDPSTNVTYTILTWMDIPFVTSHNIFWGTEDVVKVG